MKKQFWAGLVSNEIRFFTENPEGNVDGLQGLRKFTVTNQCQLTDDSGHNIVSSTNTGSTDGAGSIQSNIGNEQNAEGSAQAQPSQSQGGQAQTS